MSEKRNVTVPEGRSACITGSCDKAPHVSRIEIGQVHLNVADLECARFLLRRSRLRALARCSTVSRRLPHRAHRAPVAARASPPSPWSMPTVGGAGSPECAGRSSTGRRAVTEDDTRCTWSSTPRRRRPRAPVAATASREASRSAPASTTDPWLRPLPRLRRGDHAAREAAFVAALEAADGIELSGRGLGLLADGRVLARLASVP